MHTGRLDGLQVAVGQVDGQAAAADAVRQDVRVHVARHALRMSPKTDTVTSRVHWQLHKDSGKTLGWLKVGVVVLEVTPSAPSRDATSKRVSTEYEQRINAASP